MLLTKKERFQINEYFTEFLNQDNRLNNLRESGLFMPQTFWKNEEQSFHNNWTYMMLLVETIEAWFSVKEIVTADNYVRFDFSDYYIQDKGGSKLEAFYLVCFKVLKKDWKEGQCPVVSDSHEPFDGDE
ncbi:MAG: hypothetical protein KJ941_11695 [Bacteroidetes bacterium]|nr:hypothetical protein [Bacteroidota bacterium]